jgi:D-beta-D-heptose 7-phosphate kinase / D-beta-D-heptose 1-phosphate adenosyltransferase
LNTRIIQIIQSVSPRPITVVGDLILDTYIRGRADRISPEAPIQILDVEEESSNPGGATNVAANLRALGADVECAGVVGADREGDLLLSRLEERGIGTSCIVRDPNRPTISKTRVVSHNQQLLRIDKEKRIPLSPAVEEDLLARLDGRLAASAAVVVSDYAKGTLTPGVLAGVMKGAAGPDCFGVLVDPKGREYEKYRGARLITPNRKEAEQFTGVATKAPGGLDEAVAILRRQVEAENVVITLGAEGIYYSTDPEQGLLMPARARSVYDVTGAGDTVIAILAFFLSAGCAVDEAVRIANVGAGIVVGRLGVAAPTRAELVEAFSPRLTLPGTKILSRAEAARTATAIRKRGEKLVFTNGCFDLVHGGHLEFLRTAKATGDYLMVAVNDDASVRRMKGPTRPVLDLIERQEILASFQVVDFVVSFSEDTPLDIVKEITPDVLVKGEDWKDKGVVGREWVEEHGGEVQLVKLREGRSTTSIIDKILSLHGVANHEQN